MNNQQRLYLSKVFHSTTPEALEEVRPTIPEGSLAARLIPYMHEKLSLNQAMLADTVEKMIAAGEAAPIKTIPENPALRVVFEKLYQRKSELK